MRVVALEEHFIVPGMAARIPKAAIEARGMPSYDNAPPTVQRGDLLRDIGSGRIADMDKSGITVQVLSISGVGADLLPPAEGPAMAREANDYLIKAVAENPGRYHGFTHLPMTNPEAAADELERTVKHHGFVGGMVNGTTGGLFLDHPSFEPLLARFEALDVPLYIHPALPPAAVRDAYYGGMPGDTGFLLSMAGWGWHSETAIHVLRLVVSGTLDRHPKLKLIIGHMGEGLPAMFARCDQVFQNEIRDKLTRSVSKTITDQVWVTTSGFFALAPLLPLLMTFGVDRVLFSVDYPFAANESGRLFLDTLPLSPGDKVKIAYANADALLKLKA